MSSSNNTVMVHIRHLREKIGDDAQNPRFIKNIWGVGYTIEGIEKPQVKDYIASNRA